MATVQPTACPAPRNTSRQAAWASAKVSLTCGSPGGSMPAWKLSPAPSLAKTAVMFGSLKVQTYRTPSSTGNAAST